MTKEEKKREASHFLMENGSIINNLHRENAINSYVKEAFVAGIELGEKKLLDKAVKWLEHNFNLPSDFESYFREAMK